MAEKIIRFCPKHGETEFYYNKKYNKYICKKCVQNSVDKRKKDKKVELIKYKGGKCEICGYNKCVDALEFHHIDETTKDYNISHYMNRSIDVLKKEADKCILVCSNCHREIHHKMNEEKRNKEYESQQDFLNEHKHVNKIDTIDKDLVINMIKSGFDKKEISKKVGVSIATLTRFFSKNGINMMRNAFSYDDLLEPNENELRRMREEGMSFTEIAKHYHHSRNHISQICNKYGIK